MSDLSSEKIAKALKGAGLSTAGRIDTATEAWRDDDVFFPNKDDFLFEWVCTALTKPNLKKLSECSLLQIAYWKLLRELLEHYHTRAKRDQKQSPPVIRVHLVVAFTTLFQQLYADTTALTTNDRLEFLQVVHSCLTVLFSNSFAFSYRPTLEHMTAVVDRLLTIMLTQMAICRESNDTTEARTLQALVDVARIILERYDAQLVQAANQKKVFTVILGDIFPRLLSVRRQLPAIAQELSDILSHTLFHADTIFEYTSVFKESSLTRAIGNSKQTSFVSKLFEELSNMVETSKDEGQALDALDIMPVLFKSFVDTFRKKRQSTSSMQDLGRVVEFGFFIEACIVLKKIRDRNVKAYLESLGRIMREIVELNIYSARNDDVGKAQLAVLEEIANETISYLSDSKKNDQSLVLTLANTLLQLDFSLIETRITSLWPIMLNPVAGAEDACLTLATSVLQTYTASRQIDGFVNDLLVSLQDMAFADVYMLLEKPLFSRPFLKEFSTCISKYMPASQAIEIFDRFAQDMRAAIDVSGPVAKKQKRSQQAKPQRRYIARFIAIYFVEFVHALRLTQSQKHNFEKVTMEFFEQFLKPGLIKWKDDTTTVESTVIPALQIHFTLTNVLYDVYWKQLADSDRQWLATTFASIFKESKEQDTRTARIALVYTTNVMLQHVYFTCLSNVDPAESQTMDLINLVLDIVLDGHDSKLYSSGWDGSLIHLHDKDEVRIACWKLITDEWFDIVCRFVQGVRAEKFTSMVLLSLVDGAPANQRIATLTIQSLNESLLRSANFYEARCFKECSISTIVNALIGFFGRIDQHANDQTRILAKHIAAVGSASKDLPAEAVSLLTSSREAMEQDVSAVETENVAKTMMFINLLLSFPLEYYEKSERQQILLLSFLTDSWVISNTQADPVVRMKASLGCRSLHLRLVLHISGRGILSVDPSVLHWFVQSVDQWSVADDKTLDSLKEVTKELDRSTLAVVLASAGGKGSSSQAMTYWQETLTRRVESLKEAVGFGWTINAVVALNDYLRGKRLPATDMDDAIYAKDAMRDIAAHVIDMLQRLKGTLITAVKEEQPGMAPVEDLRNMFIMTRLLEDYARILESQADEGGLGYRPGSYSPAYSAVINTKELSSHVVALASPFTQFLQLSLRTGETGLDMTADFVATLCMTLSRYQQVDATKRVLAVIWFVHSIVSKPGAEHAVQTIAEAFKAWIQSLSKEQFDVLIESFVEQSEEEVRGHGGNNKVFLFLLTRLLHDSTDAQKRRLQRWVSTFVLRLSLIAGRTHSLDILQQIVALLAHAALEKSFEFTSYDLSLLLSCLLQIASPTAPERFQSQINRATAYQLFDDVCSVLTNLVRQHREKLVDVMPAFVGLLQALLRCFQSTHVSLIGSKRKAADPQKPSSRTIPLLFLFAPMDESAAQRYARLLAQVSLKSSGAAQNAWRVMTRHAPYLLIEYFTIQSNTTMSIALPQIKGALIPGLYEIMDMCSENDHSLIMTSLDGPGKSLFKSFYANWKENHKYSGQ
ncbi:hypothetical protein DFQ28_001467 [Apophysomyces sp. BC1034]|nr:hypothetical protein DFQ30_001887 [Apophysomyces sp. BC1015]KAG0181224.1 hypothetical protein DFQ29_009014 [Apophysomyces sp. BC1021]KAG0190840.1 hypothetical protein DFQ28_001467 [Apophysomyces sp. BC1034]